MRQIKQIYMWAIPLIAVMLLCTSYALASTAEGHTIDWYETNSSVTMKKEEFSLTGTAGQADSGAVSGAGYTLDGGFLIGGGESYSIFLPMMSMSSK